MTTLQREDVLQQRGQELYDRAGDKIGTIDEIYLDNQTDQPEWALVNTGMFGAKSTFVPLQEATHEGEALRVPYEKAQVKDAPSVDPDGELSQHEEAELYRHYGLEHNGAPRVGEDTSGETTDNAMTRSEEELRVGTTEQESGRVRLRKYVVEDEVTQTVPVKREEVRIEREPITDGNAGAATEGPATSEEEHEVVLHEEQAVVDKQAVPKERVRLDKDVQVEEETISDTVRKERVDVEDDGRR